MGVAFDHKGRPASPRASGPRAHGATFDLTAAASDVEVGASVRADGQLLDPWGERKMTMFKIAIKIEKKTPTTFSSVLKNTQHHEIRS